MFIEPQIHVKNQKKVMNQSWENCVTDGRYDDSQH